MHLLAVILFAQLAAPARLHPPVLAFPQPGLDDVASYQGYQTRFYKDAAGNTVQIYLDQRSGRVVHLLANSEDESAGFTIRGADGSLVPLDWSAADAEVAASGRRQMLAHQLRAGASEVRIGSFLLGSMRVERDFQYQRAHLAPFSADPFVLPEMLRFTQAVARLDPVDRRRHLARLRVADLPTLRARLRPRLTETRSPHRFTLRVSQPSLDARDTIAVEILTDPRQVVATRSPGFLTLRARAGTTVPFTVRVSSTVRPLTPLARSEIFSAAFLAFLASADTGTIRGKWLERQVRGVELLVSHEKLMAGLPAYATYFGRDMLLSALMMRPIWRDEMSEFVIGSALRKLSDRGEVSHEEALGGQAAREAAMEYTRLIEAWRAARQRGDAAAAKTRLAEAYALLADVRRVRENYHMIDDEFQLPVIAGRWLADSAVPAARKRDFLLSRERGVTRLELLLRELALVARMTDAYARDPRPTNLVSFPARDTGWSSASWRDSGAGYAGGRFAMDVNAIWAPHALEAMSQVLTTLSRLGVSLDSLRSAVPELRHDSPLGAYMRDPASLDRAIDTWWSASRHFVVRLSPGEIRARVALRLAAMPDAERAYWTGVMNATKADTDSLEFLALALDARGQPIGVANSDPATRLFLGESARPSDPGAARAAALRDVWLFVRPYPVGLFIDRVGPVVANDAYAPSGVWSAFERDRYHGPRVVWGREVNLFLLGAANHVAAAGTSPGSDAYVSELRRAINTVVSAVRASGFRSELWSYELQNGAVVPVRYGTGSDVQLWSTTDLAVQFALSRLR